MPETTRLPSSAPEARRPSSEPEQPDALFAEIDPEVSRLILSVERTEHMLVVTLREQEQEQEEMMVRSGSDGRGNINYIEMSTRQYAAWRIEQFLLTKQADVRVYIKDALGRQVLPSSLVGALPV